MLNKRKNNDGMTKYQFVLIPSTMALNTEFDVSFKKPLTRVTVNLLTHRIVRLKPDLFLTV